MEARRIVVTANGDISLGEVHPGYTGRWIIQIVAIAAATVTPKVSLDGGATKVTRAVTPADNSADVTALTGPGLWFMDAGTADAYLTISAAGSATIYVKPAIG